MDFSPIFVDLYNNVLNREKNQFGVNERSIRDAIQVLKEVYKPNPDWQSGQTVNAADFNDAAHRIAYVHKHALCYSGLVYTILRLAIEGSDAVSTHLATKRSLSLCSLGGGPGTDVVGALAAFLTNFGYLPCNVTIVDYFKQWKSTFFLIIDELRNGSCEIFSEMVHPRTFKYNYLDANLFSGLGNAWEVRSAVQSADLITMVKFVSAAASQHVRNMLLQFFKAMKPGAMLFYVDNAGGGFHHILEDVADQCGMVCVFGPLEHFEYEEPEFSISRFGYISQSKTKVCAQMWQKPERSAHSASQQLRREFFNPPRPRAQGAVRIAQPRSRGRRQGGARYEDAYEGDDQENGCCTIM